MATARTVRRFLLLEAAAFGVAALVHFGVLMTGGEHCRAGIAESIITGVLLAGLIASYVRPASARRLGMTAQLFALGATLVGVFAIIVGVGPRTVPDVVYHVTIIGVLVSGLLVARSAVVEDGRRVATSAR